MKKGTLLMVIGGGLLVGYLVVDFCLSASVYGFGNWLENLPLLIFSNFVAFTVGNIKAASLGVLFSIGVIMLITGVCISVFKTRSRVRA